MLSKEEKGGKRWYHNDNNVVEKTKWENNKRTFKNNCRGGGGKGLEISGSNRGRADRPADRCNYGPESKNS